MDAKLNPNFQQKHNYKSYGDIALGILMGVASVYGLWLCANLLIALLN